MMKRIGCLLALTVAAPLAAHADIDVVYGQDNRADVYQVKNSSLVTLSKSTAAMIPASAFKKAAKDKFFDLDSETLERSGNVCTSEAFSQQPTAAICSGFLIGPDTIITAGHCYKSFSTPENVCKGFVWAFDYKMDSASSDPTKNVSINNIYLCKSVIKAELSNTDDFAIIKLDRPVVGRTPVKFRKTGKVAANAKLVVIGHPTGLPTKISDGGKVINNNASKMFVTNLDTFHGNSGSAVFDATTGTVEGILVQGKTDYVPSIKNNPNSCQVVNKCDDMGMKCTSGNPKNEPPGEMVYRITNIAKYLK